MTHELKPCPFCGYHLSRDEGICCPNCAVFLPAPSENASDQDGVDAWNTRAAPQEIGQ